MLHSALPVFNRFLFPDLDVPIATFTKAIFQYFKMQPCAHSSQRSLVYRYLVKLRANTGNIAAASALSMNTLHLESQIEYIHKLNHSNIGVREYIIFNHFRHFIPWQMKVSFTEIMKSKLFVTMKGFPAIKTTNEFNINEVELYSLLVPLISNTYQCHFIICNILPLWNNIFYDEFIGNFCTLWDAPKQICQKRYDPWHRTLRIEILWNFIESTVRLFSLSLHIISRNSSNSGVHRVFWLWSFHRTWT